MSTSGNISNSSTTKNGEISGADADDDDEKKMCTSYEQNNKISGGDDRKMSTSDAQKLIGEEGSSSDIDAGSSGKSASDIDAIISEQLSDNSITSITIPNDEMFKEPPTKEDFQICFQPMPFSSGMCRVRTTYMPCCGMTLCEGCVFAVQAEMDEGNTKRWCPFCRIPIPSAKEALQRYKIRMELNDAEAFYNLGLHYRDGKFGLTKNIKKAFELWERATELGSLEGCFCLARSYYMGVGVEKDAKLGIYYMTKAALRGVEYARHNLGLMVVEKRLAMKHFMISARVGYCDSLKEVGEGYKAGLVTKEEYANVLRAYQCSCDEMKSEQRTKAAAKQQG